MKSSLAFLSILFIFAQLPSSFAGTGSMEALESLGERIFNDPRFSQHYASQSRGNVNFELKEGARELIQLQTLKGKKASPFKGSAMSCSGCHMVDQALDMKNAGMRSYVDFSKQAILPLRVGDTQTHTPRNTPVLVGIGSKFAQNRFSHHDAEFDDHSGTVLGNLTGRNMGWLASEKKEALANIVNIIRNDNGQADLAKEFGGSYKKILMGTDKSIPADFLIPKAYRADLKKLSDQQVIDKVVISVTAYMDSLDFEVDQAGNYIGSPYDNFLDENRIPRGPTKGQDVFQYTNSLVDAFKNLKKPRFVKAKHFKNHKKSFEFGEKEWRGLKIFFNVETKRKSGRGMCIACHAAPLFTDQSFHNVGTTQIEYDNMHGVGSFAKIDIPAFSKKDKMIMARVAKKDSTKVDLGAWNFYGKNKKFTDFINKKLCSDTAKCSQAVISNQMIARVKTPTIRNLGHSAPYNHNGLAKDLDTVLDMYLEAGKLQRAGELRNGAPELAAQKLNKKDLKFLKHFLNSLNEDYE
jgi:cytochrome c peroxidase